MLSNSKKNASADKSVSTAGEGLVGPTTFMINGDSTVTKIRIGKKDTALAYTQAKRRGMPCNEYLKCILQQALRKDSAGSATS